MILKRRTYIFRSLVILVIIATITIPDVLMELATELIHLILEVLGEVAHIGFEWIESMLDHLVEHELHTELHETQTIVFYIIVSILAGPLYLLARQVPRFYLFLKDKIQVSWAFNKAELALYWHSLSLNERIKLGLIALSGLYVASFFIM
ncbi:MAG: hypothetical protein WCL60_02645 [Methylococcales bacterium]|jgi:hypothetical protein